MKLHGSVNWYEEEGSGNVFRLERGYSMPSHEYRLTHGERVLRPLMIIPTLEKAVMKQPYAGLMTQFSDALKEISVFIVVGNSLRDEHLRNTVVQRSDKLEIILVNPAAGDQLDIAGRVGSTHAVPLGVEEFLEYGLGPLGVLLEELAVLCDSDARRKRASSYGTEMAKIATDRQGMTDAEHRMLEKLSASADEDRINTLNALTSSVHSTLLDRVKQLALEPGDDSVRVAAVDVLVKLD